MDAFLGCSIVTDWHDPVAIRKGELADAAALAALAARTFRDTYADGNSPSDMAAHLAQSFSREHQGRELADPTITTLVAAKPTGELVAYTQLRADPPPACVAGAQPVELWRFYVERTHHGQGVAQALMAAVLDHARARGAATLWLGVWTRNQRAQAFYRKAGFEDVGTHMYVLGTDRQTDRVFVRSPAAAGNGPAKTL